MPETSEGAGQTAQKWCPSTTPAQDLAAALHDHHERIETMLGNLATASGDGRRVVFWWLRRFLAAHEAAEQVYIHSHRSGDLAEEQDEISSQRQLEEQAAGELIARLEELDMAGPEFDSVLHQLHRAFAKHSRAEELHELPQVIDAAHPHDIERMRQAVDHVDVLVAQRGGPLGERVRPYAELLESAIADFRTLHSEQGV